MALLIKRVVIGGLAGRSEPLELNFNNDINVLYGSNGSGKTTVLRLLHSALSLDTHDLALSPFSFAIIEIVGEQSQLTLRRTLSRESPADRQLAIPETPQRQARRQQQLAWLTEPDAHSRLLLPHRYLPVSRLFGPDPRSAYYYTYEPSEVISPERIVDLRFSEMLPRLWAAYAATLSSNVRKIQEDGLANILKGVLTTTKWQLPARASDDFESLYRRVTTFLARQGSPELLGDIARFRSSYEDDIRIQSVVHDLATIEEQIEQAIRPRTRLQELLQELFTSKDVLFTDRSLSVRAQDGSEISLASLSSGEKHLLDISIESLLAEDKPLIMDEPEISLHIDWQHKLLSALTELNPRCQIICATHSPEMIADLSDSKLIRL